MNKPQQSSSKCLADTKPYREGLDPQAKRRYTEKLGFVGGADPYELAPTSWSNEDPESLPSIAYPDIVNYLVFSPSPYTAEDLKSYKGLEAYNQMVCGWVRELQYQVINDRCVVKAKVLHSQSIRETPLEPWIIAEKSGRILGAHCTCKAGLGETCTHVAALLFLIEETVKLRDSKTVTQEKAYWLLPTALSKVEYKECRKIDFTVAKRSQVKE
ncbi:uncharacterized protein LOC121639609 [Melanotaenia boesemani]|uniref:uncharacterized protein LOC121639609 n=1 Tax=Melanotaenia boesemani TaxID=1250792 RepID=UPI001C05CD5E|nr:uncharacterized protein LOC121639609 [Melanotaenia boesemani]